jgi:hypothetical protein
VHFPGTLTFNDLFALFSRQGVQSGLPLGNMRIAERFSLGGRHFIEFGFAFRSHGCPLLGVHVSVALVQTRMVG